MSLKISIMLVRQLCFTLHAIPALVLLKEVIFSHWLKEGVINQNITQQCIQFTAYLLQRSRSKGSLSIYDYFPLFGTKEELHIPWYFGSYFYSSIFLC